MNCSLPGSFLHGIFQAKVLQWAAMSFFRGSSRPSDRTQVSCIADRRFTIRATREAYLHIKYLRDFFLVLWIYSLILELLTSVPARMQDRSHWNAGKRKLCSRSLGRRKEGENIPNPSQLSPLPVSFHELKQRIMLRHVIPRLLSESAKA